MRSLWTHLYIFSRCYLCSFCHMYFHNILFSLVKGSGAHHKSRIKIGCFFHLSWVTLRLLFPNMKLQINNKSVSLKPACWWTLTPGRRGRLSSVSFGCLCLPLSVVFTCSSWHFDNILYIVDEEWKDNSPNEYGNSYYASNFKLFEYFSVDQCSLMGIY